MKKIIVLKGNVIRKNKKVFCNQKNGKSSTNIDENFIYNIKVLKIA